MTLSHEIHSWSEHSNEAGHFWRNYTLIALAICAFAIIFGQTFSSLEFANNIGRVVLERLLAVAIVSLFLERAIEVYINASRRFGELEITEQLDEAREDHPDDITKSRALSRKLARYKLGTQRMAFLFSLFFGVMIACTGLRVLDGLIVLGQETVANPYWQTRVWYGVDILLTGGMIGGGAAGIHRLIDMLAVHVPQRR